MNKMKDSGIEWIGDSPIEWNKFTIGQLFEQVKQKNTGLIEKNLLSLSYGRIKRKDINSGDGLLPESFEGYNIIEKDDIVLRMTDLQNDKTSLRQGIAEERGIITSAYITMRSIHKVSPRFVYYQLYGFDVSKGYYGMGSGVRQGVNWKDIKKLSLILPNLELQNKIAKFLDEKTALIDDIITDTKQTIEELKSYKQSLISEIVTKGINKNVKLVPSGIEWIGEVPEEWEVLKSRYFLNEISVKGYPDEEVLSLYRDYGIIPKNSRSDNHNVTSLDTSGYKLVKPGNLVINKMKAWQGSMAISNLRGIVSPAYYTFEVDNERFNLRFLHYALRNPAYKQEYMRISAGLRVGQWDLNKNEFKNIKYAFPANKEEQKAIADYLDEKSSQIDALIIEKENLISEYENYKKSMIYEYVTGKKRVEGYES
ncbi:MAG: restriction endonuclease subunit S [Streptococcus mitis]|nr:restriction endonuclease subunit S [Streptococcus mitis]